MKAFYVLPFLVAPTAAIAHTGDHSNMASALGHAFSSAEHATLSLAVMASIALVLFSATRIKGQVKASRAK